MGDVRFKEIRLRTTILLILSVAVITGVVFSSFLMLIVVPSNSMEPTLNTGTLAVGSRMVRNIERGDILVFEHNEIIMIKRVVGLSGEQVVIDSNGTVSIDGDILSESYVKHMRRGRVQRFDVPDGYLLFLGDNRQSSNDARFWDYSFVPHDSVLAEAVHTLIPRPGTIQ